MFESLIVTLREGIEAALVVGILLTYLKQIRKDYLNKAVYLGVILAVLASVIGAYIFQFINLQEELYEGTLFFIAAFFVGTMMFWMMRVAKTIKKDIHHKIDTLTSSQNTDSIWTKAGWGILLFTFLMVFREGIETVLFLSVVSFTTEAMLSFLGGIIGLILSVIFCIFFVKGTLKVNLKKFFLITEIVLGIFIVQLLINGYHEFAEAGILPATQKSMAFIGPIMRNNVLFILAIIIIPFLFLIIPGKTKINEPIPEEGPQKRKWLAQKKSQRFWKFATSTLTVLIILFISVNYVKSSSIQEISPPLQITSVNNEVKIPISDLQDKNMHRYGYQVDNVTVRFIGMKTADNKYATALDACQICGDFGYLQEGTHVVCRNCTADIFAPTIGEEGGCNPIPLKARQENGFLIIKVEDLVKSKSVFNHSASTSEETDPVCGMKLKVDASTPHLEHNGKTYYFCTMGQCQSEFKTNPDKYLKK